MAPGEFGVGGVMLGAWGVDRSSIATCGLETTALGCRRLGRIAVAGRADPARAGLGASIRNAAGSHGHRAATCAAAASTRRARTPPAGPLAVRGACPPRARRYPRLPPRPPSLRRPHFSSSLRRPSPVSASTANKVPAMVQTLPAEDFSRDYSANVVGTFVQRIPGVTANDVQGNEFALDLRYRGFAASPLQGTPQGLAVYMQGIRVNEAFGDTVNWDLISEGRDRPLGHLDQQSCLRPQRPWWRDQFPDEGRLHLQRHRVRYLRRFLRSGRRLPAIRGAQRGMGALSRGGRPQG